MAIRGIERFQVAGDEFSSAIEFAATDIVSLPSANTIVLEGHYLPALWRRFIRKDHLGRDIISVVHPAKAVLDLRVLLPDPRCREQGFLGIEVYPDTVEPEFAQTPWFSLGGPAGRMRPNLEGEWTGETINCIYPRGDIWTPRSLDYHMSEVPQGQPRSQTR